jgi:O-antigen ligase
MSFRITRAISFVGTRFNRFYPNLIQIGLAACVWFSVFANAAYDLWAACIIFTALTFLSTLLLIGHHRTRRSINLPFFEPIVFFMAALILSTRYSYDVATSQFETWIWFYSFIAFYLLINSSRALGTSHLFFVCSSVVLLPMAISCVNEQLKNHWEIHSTLINSIVMSGFVLYWLFPAWGIIKPAWFGRVLLSAALLILILGRSWSAGMSLVIGILYYNKGKIKLLHIQKGKVFILCFFLLFVLSCAVLGFKLSHQTPDYYISNRFYWWRSALKMVFANPLTGVGLGAFQTAYPYFRTGTGWGTLYAHSFPLQLISETGVLGFMSFLCLSMSIARQINSRLIYQTSLIMVLCYSLININMEYFVNKFMLLLVVAPQLLPNHRDFHLKSGKSIALTTAALFMLVPCWLILWQASTYYVSGTLNEQKQDWVAAKEDYHRAIAINSSYADAYAGLARIYKQSYQQNRSASDLTLWRSNLKEALYWKKDIRFLTDLNRPS